MKKLFIFAILLLVLSACSEDERYRFTGSGDNWDIVYTVEVAQSDQMEESGTAVYKGEGEAPEAIDYSLESALGGASGTNVFVQEGTANIGNSACSGCAVIQEDEELELEIEWDGQAETILLTAE